MPFSLILASASPRRQELLRQARIPFTVDAADVDETCGLPAEEAVSELSRRKAEASLKKHPGAFILAADTLVTVDGRSLGKPASPAEARAMLRLLSGRTHAVCTGVTVVNPEGVFFTETDVSHVTFDPMTEAETDAYVATGEPLDKAGAYAIQGQAALWIRRMEGSPSGVIGLPLDLVRRLLIKAGYPLFSVAEGTVAP
ncbi:MAG: septum formation protein Maf [Clostridia bacterium]|nr:septum formation protein Maf [Clostridia bacterium]